MHVRDLRKTTSIRLFCSAKKWDFATRKYPYSFQNSACCAESLSSYALVFRCKALVIQMSVKLTLIFHGGE